MSNKMIATNNRIGSSTFFMPRHSNKSPRARQARAQGRLRPRRCWLLDKLDRDLLRCFIHALQGQCLTRRAEGSREVDLPRAEGHVAEDLVLGGYQQLTDDHIRRIAGRDIEDRGIE